MPTVPSYRSQGFQPDDVLLQLDLVNGGRQLILRGHNPDVDTTTLPEDLIEQGGVYTFQTVAKSLEVLSSSAADAAAGTGARTVTVTGLDANYDEISEVVTLNGVGIVALTKQYLRVNSFVVTTAGSGLTNAGNITLRVASAGDIQSYIDTGDSVAHQGVYTVPRGHTAILKAVQFAVPVTGNLVGQIVMRTRNNSIPNSPFILRNYLFPSANAGSSEIIFQNGFRLTEKTDITFRVVSVSADNANVWLSGSGILLRTSE